MSKQAKEAVKFAQKLFEEGQRVLRGENADEKALNEDSNQNPLISAGIDPSLLPKRPAFGSLDLELPEPPEFDSSDDEPQPPSPKSFSDEEPLVKQWEEFHKTIWGQAPDKLYSLNEWNEWYEENKKQIDEDAKYYYAALDRKDRESKKVTTPQVLESKESDSEKFNRLQKEKYKDRDKAEAEFNYAADVEKAANKRKKEADEAQKQQEVIKKELKALEVLLQDAEKKVKTADKFYDKAVKPLKPGQSSELNDARDQQKAAKKALETVKAERAKLQERLESIKLAEAIARDNAKKLEKESKAMSKMLDSKVKKTLIESKGRALEDQKATAKLTQQIQETQKDITAVGSTIFKIASELEVKQQELDKVSEKKQAILLARKERVEALTALKRDVETDSKLRASAKTYMLEHDMLKAIDKSMDKFKEALAKETNAMLAAAKDLSIADRKKFDAIKPPINFERSDMSIAAGGRIRAEQILNYYNAPSVEKGFFAKIFGAKPQNEPESQSQKSAILISNLEKQEQKIQKEMEPNKKLLSSSGKLMTSMLEGLAKVQKRLEEYFVGQAKHVDKDLKALEKETVNQKGEDRKGLTELERKIKSQDLQKAMELGAKANSAGNIATKSAETFKNVVGKRGSEVAKIASNLVADQTQKKGARVEAEERRRAAAASKSSRGI